MHTFISRSGRDSYKLPHFFSGPKLLIGGVAIVCGTLLIGAIALADTTTANRHASRPAQAGNVASTAIAQVVITGKRLTPEQKQQFDEAEALATKAAVPRMAALQGTPK